MKKITLLMALLMWSLTFYGQTYIDEDFEGTFLPTGWTDVADAADIAGYPWAASTNAANSGTKSAFYNELFNLSHGENAGAPVAKDKWLVSSAMDLTSATSPELTYYETVRFPDFAATTGVFYSIDYAGDATTATWVAINTTFGFSSGEDLVWKIRGVFDLSAANGNATVYIGFRYQGTDNSEWFIDDVLVRETSGCIEPSFGSLSSVTTTSASFSWTSGPGGTETLWDVELVDITASGTPTGTPTTLGVTNPYSFTSLASGNMYEAYVRADCGGSTSAWSGPYAFSTAASNDECAGAVSVTHESNIALPASATATSGTIDGATDSGETACTGTADNDVWYSFVATSSIATIRVESTSASLDPVLEVFSGQCTSLVSLGCADNNSETGGEEITLSGLTVNDTYYVRVFHFWTGSPADGNFDLKVYRNVALDVEDLEVNEFKFYPNPVQDKLNLRAQNTIENVSIYNILGQEVLRIAPNTNSSEIDMSALQIGVYFVKVTINGTTETKQIIKR